MATKKGKDIISWFLNNIIEKKRISTFLTRRRFLRVKQKKKLDETKTDDPVSKKVVSSQKRKAAKTKDMQKASKTKDVKEVFVCFFFG